MTTIERLFYAGQYRAVMDAYNSGPHSAHEQSLAFVVGAYAYSGLTLEAEGLLDAYLGEMDLPNQQRANFFLAVSYNRRLRHDDAKRLLVRNCRLARITNAPHAKLYAILGLGFRHYTFGRYKRARRYNENAYRYACSTKDNYAKLIAADLIGHTLTALGDIHAGSSFFAIARDLASGFGAGAIIQALDLTQTLYRSTFGCTRNANEDLLILSEREVYQDEYSRTQLILEMVRNFTLSGELDKGEELLLKSQDWVFAMSNKRMELLHQLRLAELSFRRGSWFKARQICDSALAYLDVHPRLPETRFTLSFAGLKLKMAKACAEHECENALLSLVLPLTKQSCGALARRMLKRTCGIQVDVEIIPRGIDVLGDLMDHIAGQQVRVQELLATPYLGFLPEVVGLTPGSSGIIVDYESGVVLTLKRGNVSQLKLTELSGMQRRLLNLFCEHPQSLASIVAEVWRESRVASRHRILMQTFLRRFSDKLGLAMSDICCTSESYGFASHVNIVIVSKPQHAKEISNRTQYLYPDLNFRQRRLICGNNCNSNAEMDVSRYGKLFDVSASTAMRDLQDLVRKNFMISSGKGKAVRYLILKNLNRGE